MRFLQLFNADYPRFKDYQTEELNSSSLDVDDV
jgi:hypothetical protein